MEGIILGLEALASPWSVIGGVSVLAVVFGVVLFGNMAEEEKAGKAIFLAESPFTDMTETPAESVKYLRAA